MFDENCCKASDTFYIVKREEEGKLCGTASSFNPFSSCVGPRLKDDIEVKESVIKTTTILEQKLQRSCTGCHVKSFISTFPFPLAAGDVNKVKQDLVFSVKLHLRLIYCPLALNPYPNLLFLRP